MPEDYETVILREAARILGEGLASDLWRRGWTINYPGADDSSPLEWYWPPTLPRTHSRRQGQPTERVGPSPWIAPTTIIRKNGVWIVAFGEAVAKSPAQREVFDDGYELLAQLERVEAWPMPVAEARRLRGKRIIELTNVLARGDGYSVGVRTEPYRTRLARIRAHQQYEARGPRRSSQVPSAPRQSGDLTAQAILVEADAWVSALRTSRASGRFRKTDGQADGNRRDHDDERDL